MKYFKRVACVLACTAILCSITISCSKTNTSSSASSKESASLGASDTTASYPTGEGSNSATSSAISSAKNSQATSSKTEIVYEPVFKDNAKAESKKLYGHQGNPESYFEVYSGEREPWLWPFARDSVWNMPIGEKAIYEPSGLQTEEEISCDAAYLLKTNYSDEKLTIVMSLMNDRWPDDISKKKKNGSTYWPRGLIISRFSSGNDCSSILQPDGRSIVELQPTCRDEADSTYVIGNPRHQIDIYGDGRLGTHWGSGLATLGGCIRLGELTGDEPIRHAIKINVWADKYLYYDEATKGFTWPADRSDTLPTSKGIIKHMLEGALLAIPRNITPESVGITDRIVKKLFVCAQDYGMYISDDTVRSAYAISVDIEEQNAVWKQDNIDLRCFLLQNQANSATMTYAEDMMKLIRCLKVVTNNSPDTIGGGGKPCQPLAPNLPKVK